MFRFSIAVLLLLMIMPVLASAQRPLPRALYIIQPGPEVPGFPEHAGSLELIYNNNGSRQAFVNFLRREYNDYDVQYTCVYLMVETSHLANKSYRENLAGLLRFFRKNGVNRVEAMYYPSGRDHSDAGGAAAFAEAVRMFNGMSATADNQPDRVNPPDGAGQRVHTASKDDARFDALHFYLMPNRYETFRSFENRHSRANQELFDHILGEMKQAREAAGNMQVVVTVDADSFFGVGETIVYSTGMSFGISISSMADKVSVMNYRDFATGTRRAGDGSQTAGLLLNIRPVLHVLGRDNIRADMVVNAAPYRHPRYGNKSGFSSIPGYRDGRSGRRDLNRQLRRTERYLTTSERTLLDHISVFYYGAW
ncbi:MAG: hypothetical protein EA364_09870 [Balneolaceae bacterium]|nr:MAG: hypothetical protein EA364_09870 [Balneolaceae bacterium]